MQELLVYAASKGRLDEILADAEKAGCAVSRAS
jgi:vanillin dehydrogenase